MNNRLQFKLAGSKAHFGNHKTIKSLKELIHPDTNYEQLQEIKLSYCEKLISLEGMERLQQVRQLYISSNSITSLMGLKGILRLQVLQAKNNKISSLTGLEHFNNLQKVIVPYNMITNLEPLSSFQSHNSLNTVVLFANQIQQLDQLHHLNPFTQLAQIVLQTQTQTQSDNNKHPLLKDLPNIQYELQKGNPLCKNRAEYHRVLRESLIQSTGTLERIDDMTGKNLVKFMVQGNQNTQNENHESLANTGNVQVGRYKTQYKKNTVDKNEERSLYTLRNQEVMLMTERQADLQRILDIKEDTICQLKSKLNTLEMTHAVQYKDSLKKESEYERSIGQLSELSRQIQFKDSQINQLHKRIEELFKTNANNHLLTDTKSQELEKTRKQLVDLKIENARLTALNNHFETSTRDLQQKALFNFQDKSRRMQEIRHRNEQLIKDQFQMERELSEYKDRVRELTQLLKEWEYKYEKKIGQLQNYHNNQRGELMNEFSKREEENVKRWEQQMRKQVNEADQKMKLLEDQYSKVLDETLHKYKQLKEMYDHKSHSQAEVKSFLKSVLSKNGEYESHLKQFQEVILASRSNIAKLTQENDYLIKQCQQIRSRWMNQSQSLKSQLSKSQFACEKMQAELKDLKINNEYLQKNFDHFSMREKEMQEMIEKVDNLQTALDAKNIMLDDKNQTIDSLKLQIQSLQKEQEKQVDAKQFDKISKKYSRQKQILKNLQEQISKLSQQNKELSDKMEVYNNMQEQFMGIRQIIAKQELEIKEKSEAVDELTEYLHKLKQIVQNLTQENKNLRVQNNKVHESFQNKEQKMMRLAKEKENQFEKRMIFANQEITKYKGFAEQLQNFTKNLKF